MYVMDSGIHIQNLRQMSKSKLSLFISKMSKVSIIVT